MGYTFKVQTYDESKTKPKTTKKSKQVKGD